MSPSDKQQSEYQKRQTENTQQSEIQNKCEQSMFDQFCNFFGLPNRVSPDPCTGKLFLYQNNRPNQP